MSEHKVMVYSTPSCPYCSMAKQFLKENNIEFDDIDVALDPKAAAEMIIKSGQQGVPVIDIDGNIIVGFNLAKIKELLEL